MTIDQKQRLGMALNIARLECDMTQAEAAELVGVSKDHVNKVERGQGKPSIGLLFKMVEAYDTTLATIAEQAGI